MPITQRDTLLVAFILYRYIFYILDRRNTMRKLIAKEGRFTVGRGGNKIEYLILHYTGNNGDTAYGNCQFFNRESGETSAHYFVDENEVCRSLEDKDTAHAAGVWSINQKSLNIEMCSRIAENGAYYIPKATVDRTVKFIVDLMIMYKIPLNKVVRHYDISKKPCPEPFVRVNADWVKFKKDVEEEYTKRTTPQPSKKELKKWSEEAREWAVDMAIATAKPKDVDYFSESVTKEELMVFLMRYNSSLTKGK